MWYIGYIDIYNRIHRNANLSINLLYSDQKRFRPSAKILCADNSAAVCQQKHFSQDEECLEVN